MEPTLIIPSMKLLKMAKVQYRHDYSCTLNLISYSIEYFNGCSITVSSCLILTVCSPMDMSGFQMIVQSANSSEVHKLHVSQSMDFQTPVTVEVKNGIYQVTILERIWILDSNASHVEYVMSTPITISTCTTTTSGVCVCSMKCSTVISLCIHNLAESKSAESTEDATATIMSGILSNKLL